LKRKKNTSTQNLLVHKSPFSRTKCTERRALFVFDVAFNINYDIGAGTGIYCDFKYFLKFKLSIHKIVLAYVHFTHGSY